MLGPAPGDARPPVGIGRGSSRLYGTRLRGLHSHLRARAAPEERRGVAAPFQAAPRRLVEARSPVDTARARGAPVARCAA